MPRLQYSMSGFERAVMMARAAIVAIVEGVDDNLFYDKLIAQYLFERDDNRRFQIRTPKEVSATADGKDAVIQIFRKFRSKKRLSSSSGTKRTIFFIDQDYDAIRRRKLRSKHLIYTPGVSFENCLYEQGGVVDAVESLICRRVDRSAFAPAINFSAWLANCAHGWRDWIVYCVASELSGIATRRNRSSQSAIHEGIPPSLIAGQPALIRTEFDLGVGSAQAANDYWRRAESIVDRAIRTNADRVFCGKWFKHFITSEVRAMGGVYIALSSRVSAGRGMMSQLLRGLVFRGAAKTYYFRKLDLALT